MMPSSMSDSITLVTGSSGFVGSALVAMMRERGMQVRDISRTDKNSAVVIPSYGPDIDWTNSLNGIRAVVHLAARVHVMRETSSDPLSAFREANVEATLNLARQAASHGVKRFVFVSTIKVNGETTQLDRPFTSADHPNPQDPYGRSKAEAEAALLALGHETGMEIVIVRPPLVYGPGVGGNFRLLMKWAVSGAPSIFPCVQNKRSLIYVGNLCDLLIRVIDHPNAAGKIFLASDDCDVSTHELLSALTRGTGKTPRSLPVPLKFLQLTGKMSGRGEALQRLTDSLQVDVTATCKTLSWEPDRRVPLLLSRVWTQDG
ncbi:NAD-dependent epimerase/dehydratase family protein [Agrobacterium tumefaciens]|uniref:NAD-dependent epimerase/dehydratase family protein n=1 Tax=Agrobacterium tumefaciens TaxID=358 RepID=UPI00287F0988|nr:NAD-dependent epimerase/dehydratase family protein [Agrobacterium tumefaciens]MDS7594776.1 NAD-dependent epimerase/dehydratase family protein [Agrobacterium tumefaciens]